MEMIDCHMPNCKEQEGVYNIEKFLARLERLLTYDLKMSPFKISLLLHFLGIKVAKVVPLFQKD